MDTPTPTPPDKPRPEGASLYLRTDGTMLLVRGSQAVEIPLAPRQLLELGTDALRMALDLDPSLGAEVADVLANTHVIVPMEAAPCVTLN